MPAFLKLIVSESTIHSFLLLLLLSCFSRVRLCATPWTAAHQGLPSMGFSRQEYWSGVPSPYIFFFSHWEIMVMWDSLSLIQLVDLLSIDLLWKVNSSYGNFEHTEGKERGWDSKSCSRERTSPVVFGAVLTWCFQPVMVFFFTEHNSD